MDEKNFLIDPAGIVLNADGSVSFRSKSLHEKINEISAQNRPSRAISVNGGNCINSSTCGGDNGGNCQNGGGCTGFNAGQCS